MNSLIRHLTANYDVTIERVSPSFAQLSVTHRTVHSALILAIDWRARTVRLDVGPRSRH